MSSAHRITAPCTCVNNTSCNQLKVVPESEIQALRGKEWQRGVWTLELLTVGSEQTYNMQKVDRLKNEDVSRNTLNILLHFSNRRLQLIT